MRNILKLITVLTIASAASSVANAQVVSGFYLAPGQPLNFATREVRLYIVPYSSANAQSNMGSEVSYNTTLPSGNTVGDLNKVFQHNTFTFEVWGESLSTTTGHYINGASKGFRRINFQISLSHFENAVNANSNSSPLEIVPTELQFLNPTTIDDSAMPSQLSRVNPCYTVQGGLVNTSITKTKLTRSIDLFHKDGCGTSWGKVRLASFDVQYNGRGVLVAKVSKTDGAGSESLSEFPWEDRNWPSSLPSAKIDRTSAGQDCQVIAKSKQFVGAGGFTQNVSVTTGLAFTEPPMVEFTITDPYCSGTSCTPSASTELNYNYASPNSSERTITYNAKLVSGAQTYTCGSATTKVYALPAVNGGFSAGLSPDFVGPYDYRDGLPFSVFANVFITDKVHYSDVGQISLEILSPSGEVLYQGNMDQAMSDFSGRLGMLGSDAPPSTSSAVSVATTGRIPIAATGLYKAVVRADIGGTTLKTEFVSHQTLSPYPVTPVTVVEKTTPHCGGTWNMGTLQPGPHKRVVTLAPSCPDPSNCKYQDIREIIIHDATNNRDYYLPNRGNVFKAEIAVDRNLSFDKYRIVYHSYSPYRASIMDDGIPMATCPAPSSASITYQPANDGVTCKISLYRLPSETAPSNNIIQNWTEAGWAQNQNRTSTALASRRYVVPNSYVMAKMDLYKNNVLMSEAAIDAALKDANVYLRIQKDGTQDYPAIFRDSRVGIFNISDLDKNTNDYVSIVGAVDRYGAGPFLSFSDYIQGGDAGKTSSEPVECVAMIEPKDYTSCSDPEKDLEQNVAIFKLNFDGAWGMELRVGKVGDAQDNIEEVQGFGPNTPDWGPSPQLQDVTIGGITFARPVMPAGSDQMLDVSFMATEKKVEEAISAYSHEGHYIKGTEYIMFFRHALSETYPDSGLPIHLKSVVVADNDTLFLEPWTNYTSLTDINMCRVILIRNDEQPVMPSDTIGQ